VSIAQRRFDGEPEVRDVGIRQRQAPGIHEAVFFGLHAAFFKCSVHTILKLLVTSAYPPLGGMR
jgi:hypothetical protein